MSRFGKIDNLTPSSFDSAEVIEQVGSPEPYVDDDRDGAIARHYNMLDPRTVMNIDRLRNRVAKSVGVIALTGAVLVANYYAKDVMPERERLEHTHSSVTFTQEALEPHDSERGTIAFTGWGTMNAKNIVTSLPYEEIGQEAYFTYDPAGISHRKNAEAAIEFANERGLDRVVLHGSSMGGNMALKTAALLHEDENAPAVEAIILDCTPLSADAVWPERRLAGDRMLRLTSAIPGAENSRSILGMAMTIDRKDQYMDGTKLDWGAAFETGARVRERILQGRDAPIELRNAQLRIILEQGAEDDIKILSNEKNGKPAPHIFLLVPADSKSDPTVDNDTSAEVLVDLHRKHGIDVTVISLPQGTGHANPAQRPEQYSLALERDVFPVIERERIESQLSKYTTRKPTKSPDSTNVADTPNNALAEATTEVQLNDDDAPAG